MLKDKIVALLAAVDTEVLREFFNCEVQAKKWDWDIDEVSAFRKVLTDEGIAFEQSDRYGGEDKGSDYWSV